MILYQKKVRLLGIFYGGQGFADENRILTDWYDEDDPAFEIKQKEIRKSYDYFHKIIIQEKFEKRG